MGLIFFLTFFSLCYIIDIERMIILSKIFGVIGVLIAIFSRKNPHWRKFGIAVAIVVPVVLIVFVYLIGYLNSIFLH